ncbi:hypothetical protein [Frateuria sp. YIM B11624]|uniref:hypothetical protein n=1 Tax=Frateuria sp. YIM B11624 TaxID=3143185 RepID=UPI003C716943
MLAADRNTPSKDGKLIAVPVAAGAKIFAGALVAANATGYATRGATATTLTYLGRAEEFADNTNGADGDVQVMVRRAQAFLWKNSGTDPVTQASLGKLAYIVDDETVSKTNAGGNTQSAAGIVIGVDASGVWIV